MIQRKLIENNLNNHWKTTEALQKILQLGLIFIDWTTKVGHEDG
jgi:hypothetical protein